ncbi:hypothetical protein ACFFX0_04490 [Citricoccus parietis]|uniref:Uncharacterized protein n=1 Tax=Citricoccus parietis TaxID=592307 RepID=A0ABV5FUX2_9MICC
MCQLCGPPSTGGLHEGTLALVPQRFGVHEGAVHVPEDRCGHSLPAGAVLGQRGRRAVLGARSACGGSDGHACQSSGGRTRS